MKLIRVVDSHTGGEPTRVIVDWDRDLGGGSVADRLRVFEDKYDAIRSGIVTEPRGSDVLVGALMLEPEDPECVAGVVFFNNVGYLGMCGHGTIGLIATLSYLGRIGSGTHRVETPVGVVETTLREDGQVSIDNVPSYRKAASVVVDVDGVGEVVGDVAWGGNWFFLVNDPGREIALENVDALTSLCRKIRKSVNEQGYPEVDHIELFGPPKDPANNSRNFVLCPGGAYDRSPCGTGTSAKIACLAEDGKLAEGEIWRQESVTGSVFHASYRVVDREVIPRITGRAFVTADSSMVLDEADPFCWGIGKGT